MLKVCMLTISTLQFAKYSQTIAMYSFIYIGEYYFQREKWSKLSNYMEE